ncbi:MAG: glucose 1-dehydrogenase [Candidatus Tectomicrobia bacterium]|uniref:Glucose 1-dehydrogenase n=1 Tax=Tectimicrobiota bacterium TaxID=2528274 RepID=A0A933GKM2_UNCTE|nr:glucose 1-dehydrogenase [Candidatus Tectomicrobia bacterium]
MVLDQFKLDGKVALVTGGGRGLGKSMAQSLAEAGADLILVSRQLKILEEAAHEMELLGRRALPIAADITKYDEVERATRQALDYFGKIDILVNNSGMGVEKTVLELTPEDWDNVLDLNLKAVFLCCKSVGAHMVNRREGKIINISSMFAFIASTSISSYCASKGGMVQLTKALALEWARYNIQVNALCPGYFITDLNRDFFNSEKGKDYAKQRVPMRRLGDPAELGGMLVYLASPASSYVTGAAFVIDGGQTVM